MPIANYRIKKVTGVRSDLDAKEVTNVDVSSNFTILSVDKKRDSDIGDYLLVNFHFAVTYKPDLGKVELDGFLWYTDKNMDKIATEKDGRIEIQAEALKDISSTILRDTLLEAVDITRKLKLPVPLAMPKVTVKPNEVSFPKASSVPTKNN